MRGKLSRAPAIPNRIHQPRRPQKSRRGDARADAVGRVEPVLYLSPGPASIRAASGGGWRADSHFSGGPSQDIRITLGGELSIRAWLRSFGGRSEFAWFKWDDPLPFLTVWARFAIRGIEKLFGGRITFRRPRAGRLGHNNVDGEGDGALSVPLKARDRSRVADKRPSFEG